MNTRYPNNQVQAYSHGAYANNINILQDAKMFIDYYNTGKQLESTYQNIQIRQNINAAFNSVWQQPLSLSSFQHFSSQLPTFQCLHAGIIKTAENIARELNMLPCEVVLAIIGSISIASHGAFKVNINNNYSEPVNLYIIMAKESGTKKTALISMVTEGIRQYQEELQQSFNSSINNTQFINAALAKFNRDISNEIAKAMKNGVTSQDIEKMAREASDAAIQYKQGYLPVLMIADATHTALEQELLKQGCAIGLCGSEDALGKLKLKDKNKPFPNILLNSYDGGNYTKVTHNARSVTMSNPSISILTAMQPEIALSYYDKEHLHANGFLNRFLVCFMQKTYINNSNCNLYGQPLAEADPIGSKITLSNYHKRVYELSKASFSQQNPRQIQTLALSTEADKCLQAYQHELCSATGLYPASKSFMSKHAGKAARIAACLHLWRHASPMDFSISVEDMFSAVELTKWLFYHNNDALDKEPRQTMHSAKRIINWIIDSNKTMFKLSELSQGLHNMPKYKAVPALQILEKHNYLRLVTGEKGSFICIRTPYLIAKENI